MVPKVLLDLVYQILFSNLEKLLYMKKYFYRIINLLNNWDNWHYWCVVMLVIICVKTNYCLLIKIYRSSQVINAVSRSENRNNTGQ